MFEDVGNAWARAWAGIQLGLQADPDACKSGSARGAVEADTIGDPGAATKADTIGEQLSIEADASGKQQLKRTQSGSSS